MTAWFVALGLELPMISGWLLAGDQRNGKVTLGYERRLSDSRLSEASAQVAILRIRSNASWRWSSVIRAGRDAG